MQRRSSLRRNAPLRQGTKGLTTRRGLERRTPLRKVSDRKLTERGLVERSGDRGYYHYEITPAGRDAMESFA